MTNRGYIRLRHDFDVTLGSSSGTMQYRQTSGKMCKYGRHGRAWIGDVRLMRTLAMTALLLLVGVLAACSTPASPGGDTGSNTTPTAGDLAPATAPDITGIITSKDTPGGVLIEENPDEASGSAKAHVSIVNETRIFKQQGQELRPATVGELEVGQQVQAWFTGPVRESYPLQATAGVIVIVNPGSTGI